MKTIVTAAGLVPVSVPEGPNEPVSMLEGLRVLAAPTTEKALKDAISKIDQPEGGLSVWAYIEKVKEGWVIHHIQVTNRADNMLRLVLLPDFEGPTSIVTKLQTPKFFGNLQTLWGRLSDIVGKNTPLLLMFNFLPPEDGRP